MGGLHFYILLVVVFSIGILNSSVDGFMYFRHGRLGKSLNDSMRSIFERKFTQKLDHFNPNEQREWQQVYFVNDDYFDKSSRNVAFLFISGESAASSNWMESGHWFTTGLKYKPIYFLLEHRYYGRSRPTVDASTENLAYLSSEQALADLANFIEAMNKQYNLSSEVKWIVFGGSYAGSLAAWMRLKYPNLVHGAVSSSGPVLAKLDFSEYFQVVQEALRANSEECVNAVQEATRQLDALLLDPNELEGIDRIFRTCDRIEDNINNPLDISNFYQNLANNFAVAAQYSDIQMINIMAMCRYMTDERLGAEVNRLARANSFVMAQHVQRCMDYKYDNMVANYKKTSWDSVDGGRQWLYQTCTEFGFFGTSNYKPQIFGDKFDLDFNIRQCEDIFGPEFNKTFQENAVARTNKNYGGLDIKVDNVVFVQGSLDPWSPLGVKKSQDKSPAILIEGASHGDDMYDPIPSDSQNVLNARAQIKDFIASLLA